MLHHLYPILCFILVSTLTPKVVVIVVAVGMVLVPNGNFVENLVILSTVAINSLILHLSVSLLLHIRLASSSPTILPTRPNPYAPSNKCHPQNPSMHLMAPTHLCFSMLKTMSILHLRPCPLPPRWSTSQSISNYITKNNYIQPKNLS